MKIRYFLMGLLVGSLMVGVAWAAQGLVLVSGNGTELGTTANPLYAEAV